MLGGGGFTGGVYEIGALRALDLLSVNRTVNEFDVYVGTSAGSFVASLAANGVTPEEMMRVVNQQVPTPFRDIDLGQLLRPNLVEFARKGVMLPLRAAQTARELLPHLGQISVMDFALGLAEGLPGGIYSGSGIEHYMRTVLADPDRTDDFRMLENELYLAATDLDTCERIVFGANDWDDVPISTAVRASTALPMVYKPVKVRDRELDRRRHRLDDEPRHRGRGRREVRRRRQPARALRQRLHAPRLDAVRLAAAARQRHGLPPDRLPGLQDAGLPAPARDGQAVGGPLPRRRHRADRARARRRADVPDVDHELHEPRRHRPPRLRVGDAEARRTTTTASTTICERHGIEISATRVRKVVKHFGAEPEKTRAWRRILEQTTGTLLRQSGS